MKLNLKPLCAAGLALLMLPLSACITRDYSRYGLVARGDFTGRPIAPETIESIHCGYRLFLPPIPFRERDIKQAMQRAFDQLPESGNALSNVQIQSRYRIYFPVIESCFVVKGTPARVPNLAPADSAVLSHTVK